MSLAWNEWYPHVGLVASMDGHIGVVSFDGYFEVRGGLFPLLGWWPSRKRMVFLSNDGEMLVEPMAFMTQKTAPKAQTDAELGAGFPAGSGSYIKLQDRRIYYYFNQLRSIDFAGINTLEASLSFGFFGRVHPGRKDTEIFVSHENHSRGIFFDTVSKTFSSPMIHIGMNANWLTYAPEFGVFVSCHSATATTPNQIRVWSLEVQPTTISPVEVLDGDVKSGQVVTYRVQVTGAQGDPAEGELVDWSIGSPGTGELLDYQSKTDANGYATTQVRYLIGEVGESNVEARVVC